jgi:integrase
VGEAMNLYKEHMLSSGRNKDRSVDDAVYRLGKFFTKPDQRLRALTPAKCEIMYEEMRTRPRVIRLAGGKTRLGPVPSAGGRLDIKSAVAAFLDWCVRKTFITTNPAASLHDDGLRNHGAIGKSILSQKELRAYFKAAVAQADTGDERAVGALMPLVLGMRSTEIVTLRARFVDDELWSIEIPILSAKTTASARVFAVPPVLRPYLSRLLKGKAGEQFVFGDGETPHWRDWVSENVGRICRELKFPQIESAHGLRGAHNDLARQAGSTGDAVIRQLGHESESTTRRSYTSNTGKRAVSAGQQGQVLRVLSGGKAGGVSGS